MGEKTGEYQILLMYFFSLVFRNGFNLKFKKMFTYHLSKSCIHWNTSLQLELSYSRHMQLLIFHKYTCVICTIHMKN